LLGCEFCLSPAPISVFNPQSDSLAIKKTLDNVSQIRLRPVLSKGSGKSKSVRCNVGIDLTSPTTTFYTYDLRRKLGIAKYKLVRSIIYLYEYITFSYFIVSSNAFLPNNISILVVAGTARPLRYSPSGPVTDNQKGSPTSRPRRRFLYF
jgi:hypothetical protein